MVVLKHVLLVCVLKHVLKHDNLGPNKSLDTSYNDNKSSEFSKSFAMVPWNPCQDHG